MISLQDAIAGVPAAEKAQFLVGLDSELTVLRLRAMRQWDPRPYQLPLWRFLEHGGKRACVVWHRRSGKDAVAMNWACEFLHRRIGEIWHMLPEAAQARKAVWDAVDPHTGRRRIDQAFPPELRAKTRDNEMSIQFKNGSLWRVVGSDNYESLIGSTPVGVVFSEWALSDPNSWGFLRPILLENDGVAIFITTPRGANHARKTFDLARLEPDSWFAELLTTKETGVFSDEKLAGELRELQHDYGEEEGRALFEQEYNCSWESALVGSYYGSYLVRASAEGRIGRVPIDRAVPVHTGWDLGVSDSTSIWFVQCVGRERRLVDYYEGSGVGLDEYARVLDEKARQFKWVYGKHYFPHDVAHRELGNRGLSRADTLRGLGIKPVVVPQANVNDGINAVRRMLDSTWIDEVRCDRGLNALRNYRRAWDERLKTFRDNAIHDWSSHGADALRTFASGHRDPKERRPELSDPPRIVGGMHERGTGWMANR